MSAAELIARYGISQPEASFVSYDIEQAIQFNRWAAEFRLDGLNGTYGTSRYLKYTGEMHFLAYRGQARANGWRISKLIDSIVRAEEASVADIVSAGMAKFAEPACSDETCVDCERPLWHHIDVNQDCRLCPMGRRFWQIAREIQSRDNDDTPLWFDSVLREIAKRP